MVQIDPRISVENLDISPGTLWILKSLGCDKVEDISKVNGIEQYVGGDVALCELREIFGPDFGKSSKVDVEATP